MKLLVAEDDRDLASAIRRLLEIAKYDVDVAYDGVQALSKIRDYPYDLVILDVMMPRMDGYQVARTVRANRSSVPILMLTARGEIDDKVMGLDSGADDYLTKPFQVKELLARVRALLRRKGEVTDSYSIGNVILDHETFELKTAQKAVHLTNKEYRLMETLIRNKNALISTERLMESVWDYDSEAEINVVWAYISSLRKRLEEIGADVMIKAARGVGYQLVNKE
ncbi:MAG: response regulator transcription factor [Bacilli bacterium]|nr:response regulator transcription factor [Bacilli bacterium]